MAGDAEAALPNAPSVVEAAAAVGNQFETRAGRVLAALVLLFLGCVVPLARLIPMVRDLRAQADRARRLERRIRARDQAGKTWGKASDGPELLGGLDLPFAAACPDEKRALATFQPVIKQVTRFMTCENESRSCLSILREGAGPLDLCCRGVPLPPSLQRHCEDLQSLRDACDMTAVADCNKVEQMRKDYVAAEAAQWKTEKELPAAGLTAFVEMNTRRLRAACGRVGAWRSCDWDRCDSLHELCGDVALLQAHVRQRQSEALLTQLTEQGIDLKLLGLFGLSFHGLEDLKLPSMFVPAAWSGLLVYLLLSAARARSSILQLYVDECAHPPLVDEQGRRPRARWWWLAPLPRYGGDNAPSDRLRVVLGWQRDELAMTVAVVLLLLSLLIMQATVLGTAVSLLHAFSDGVDGWPGTSRALSFGNDWPQWDSVIIVVAIFVCTAIECFVVLWWLNPWAQLQDPASQPPSRDRRRLLANAFVGIGLVALCGYLGRPDRSIPAAAISGRRPRFRRKKARRCTRTPKKIAPGFYLNARRKTLHWVTRELSTTARTIVGHPKPRPRVPLIRLEAKLHRRQLAVWRRWSMRAKSQPKRERHPRSARDRKQPQPLGPGVRYAWNVNVSRLRPVAIDMVRQARGLYATPGVPGTVEAADNDVAAHRWWAQPTRFRVSAIEEQALMLLSNTKSADNVDNACSFLRNAIVGAAVRDRSMLRLYDLFALIAVRHERTGDLNWLVDRVSPLRTGVGERVPELERRAKGWLSPNSSWRRKSKKRKTWARLPM